ncbi:hypothetical protein I6F35_33525 [Bradyrhizobium sp. BRP22]|uniref:hypothetical protein n=1 Tax=Bradyrhizobium sp. BRP22 TaxID=2793821 RepID=UPI001CD7F2E1|nr:hypothetical protein [Bradyrhizobium sp. BRP22]MCA1458056.1 hypothetical protein [Bradyrhizobium sp. BRP22]
MSAPDSVIDVAHFVSDMRAAIDKHAADAGRTINRMNRPAGEISAPTKSDELWAAFLAFHNAVVDWIVAEGIREDKLKATVMVDIGLRMFLDNTREAVLAAELEKRRPTPNIIGLRQ